MLQRGRPAALAGCAASQAAVYRALRPELCVVDIEDAWQSHTDQIACDVLLAGGPAILRRARRADHAGQRCRAAGLLVGAGAATALYPAAFVTTTLPTWAVQCWRHRNGPSPVFVWERRLSQALEQYHSDCAAHPVPDTARAQRALLDEVHETLAAKPPRLRHSGPIGAAVRALEKQQRAFALVAPEPSAGAMSDRARQAAEFKAAQHRLTVAAKSTDAAVLHAAATEARATLERNNARFSYERRQLRAQLDRFECATRRLADAGELRGID